MAAQQHRMKLVSQDVLRGFGSVGEGVSIQLTRDGRRIIWVAHENAPKNFTGVDVSDPRAPKVIAQTELPHAAMRSNSLEISGDLMAVAYQVSSPGLAPAGFELFDISVPENPRLISSFDASGPTSRGCHALWFVDGTTVHMSCSDPDLTPRNPLDDQIYRIVDVSNPSKPTAVGSWHLPGTMESDREEAPTRLREGFDWGFRAHNCNVYPERPDRCYVGYLDGGAFILDISDRARPQVVGQFSNSPPFNGFTHTALPIFSKDLLVVSDESIFDAAADWPKRVWLVDMREEQRPIAVSTLPMPPVDAFKDRGGRYGAHNLHENVPIAGSWRSEQFVIGTFFNGGVRAYDIADPFSPREVAFCVPEAPKDSRVGAVQINDVFVDDRGIAFAVERHAGGLYAIELNF